MVARWVLVAIAVAGPVAAADRTIAEGDIARAEARICSLGPGDVRRFYGDMVDEWAAFCEAVRVRGPRADSVHTVPGNRPRPGGGW